MHSFHVVVQTFTAVFLFLIVHARVETIVGPGRRAGFVLVFTLIVLSFILTLSWSKALIHYRARGNPDDTRLFWKNHLSIWLAGVPLFLLPFLIDEQFGYATLELSVPFVALFWAIVVVQQVVECLVRMLMTKSRS